MSYIFSFAYILMICTIKLLSNLIYISLIKVSTQLFSFHFKKQQL